MPPLQNAAQSALSDEMKRRGVPSASFRHLSRSTQQDVFRAAMQSEHAKERMSERGVTQEQIDDAMANPLHREQIKTDGQGRRSQKLIGREATAVVNPDTGVIITTYRTKSKYRRRYEREQGAGE